jgi:two-component system, OmpR family, sensor kinase
VKRRRRERGDVDSDRSAVRRAAVVTASQVAAVSTGVVVLIVGLAVGFIIDQSQPSELLEKATPGQDKIYVDVPDVLIALVVLGAFAIVLVGAASWFISRRAVTPLGAALQVQRAFVADASHELRSPLTVLDGRVQVLQRKLDRGESYEATMRALRGDARSMIDLVTDLLLVAEEGGTSRRMATVHQTDIRAVTDAAIADMQVIADERSISVGSARSVQARVGMSEMSFRRCLVVLIDNAIAHSPDGGRVDVSTTVDRRTVTVRVTDQGPGIQGIDVDQIFERFARAEASESQAAGRRSFGIGLALVRDLTARHGGRVLVEATSTSGTTMRLELPKLTPRAVDRATRSTPVPAPGTHQSADATPDRYTQAR